MKNAPRVSVLTPSIRPQYLAITQKTLEEQTFQDFEWIVEVGLPSRGFTLPSDYNKMLKRAQGDIIISLQDCITLPKDSLERAVKLFHEKQLWTFPVIKAGKEDWRTSATLEQSLDYGRWEIDFGMAPRQAFYDVGGFDEAYCGGWSCDNVEIGMRMVALGYEIHCDPSIRAEAIDHDKEMEHPFRQKLEFNGDKLVYTKHAVDNGEVRLRYLD